MTQSLPCTSYMLSSHEGILPQRSNKTPLVWGFVLGYFTSLYEISQNASDSVRWTLAELGLPVLGAACRESWSCCGAGAGALGTSSSRWHQGCALEGGGKSLRGEPRSSWFSVESGWIAIYDFLIFFPQRRVLSLLPLFLLLFLFVGLCYEL